MKCRWNRGWRSSHFFTAGGLVGGVVVQTRCSSRPFGHGGVDELEEPQELLVAVPAVVLGDHRAAGDVQRGEQAGRAVPDVVVGHPRRGGGQHRQARARSGPGPGSGDFSSTPGPGPSPAGQVEADDVADLVDELRVGATASRSRTRCGLRPNARQIRETADWDMPVAAAIDRVDQCVSSPGPRLFQGLGDDQLDLLVGDRPRRARAAARRPAPPAGRARTAPATCAPSPARHPAVSGHRGDRRAVRARPARSAPATPTPATSSAAAPSLPGPAAPRRSAPAALTSDLACRTAYRLTRNL